jgi:hypothetical protein
MRIFAGVFRIFTILAIAALTTIAARAQRDHDSVDRDSCADVKPPVINPAETIDNIPIYIIPSGAKGHRAICQATEALAEGMVDIEIGDDIVLADALGDPAPDTNIGEVSEYPYLAPGSIPTPGLPPPGPSPERAEGSHGYAAFIDPDTGGEYTFSSVADSVTDIEAAGLQWITSTVEPLLKHRPSQAKARLATANVASAAANAADGTGKYDTRAWSFITEATIAMPDNKLARGTVANQGRDLGSSGAIVRIYRLNAGSGANDYFLVDMTYTQTPRYDPFYVFPTQVNSWANQRTKLELKARYPRGIAGPLPALFDFAPRTAITGRTETFTVGAELSSAPGAGVSASYSVTTTQDSVDTTVNATLGSGLLQWNDTYHGFPSQNPPSTSTKTFTGERLAIFAVSRTINDNVPSGLKYPGLEFYPHLLSEVQAEVLSIFLPNRAYSAWGINLPIFAAEPRFSLGSRDVTVSRSKNNVRNPVRVNVLAELEDHAQQVAWQVTNPLSSIAAIASVTRGNGEIEIYPTSSTDTGETGGTISVDSSPSGAADSLRNGPINIKVTIEP